MIDATYVAVDRGTSSFRLWVHDSKGQLLAERYGDRGMAMLEPTEFEGVLEETLSELGLTINLR